MAFSRQVYVVTSVTDAATVHSAWYDPDEAEETAKQLNGKMLPENERQCPLCHQEVTVRVKRWIVTAIPLGGVMPL